MKKELESEQSKTKMLGSKVAQLNEALSASQEALNKEQKIVDKVVSEQAQNKVS